MKKIFGTVILLTILGVAGYFLFPKAPDLIGIKPTNLPSFKGKTSTLNAEAKFDNTNYFGLTLVGHDIDVFIGDKQVGNVTQTETKSIPARDKFSIPVKVSFETSQIFGGGGFLKNLIKTAVDSDLVINYKGTVDVKVLGLGIPVKVDYSQKLIDFSFNNPEEQE